MALSLRASVTFLARRPARWKRKRDGAGEIGDLTAVKAHYHAVAGLEKKRDKNKTIINKDKQIGRQEMESKQNWQGHLGFSLEPICISLQS